MSTRLTPNEDEIGVKVRLVRQPLSVQGNDHHRAERLLLHPARSSLLEESSEARIKVPIGNMSRVEAGREVPLAGSQGCVYLGSVLLPLVCLPRPAQQGDDCVTAVAEGLAVLPHGVMPWAGEANHHGVHYTSCRTINSKDQRRESCFPHGHFLLHRTREFFFSSFQSHGRINREQ